MVCNGFLAADPMVFAVRAALLPPIVMRLHLVTQRNFGTAFRDLKLRPVHTDIPKKSR